MVYHVNGVRVIINCISTEKKLQRNNGPSASPRLIPTTNALDHSVSLKKTKV